MNIVKCRGNLQMSSGLDDWVYCTLHIRNSELRAIQRYRYSTHFQFTVAHVLGCSVFISHILATDL
jgi:hypothetical protein